MSSVLGELILEENLDKSDPAKPFYRLAEYYYNGGEIIPKDPSQAVFYYKKAAKFGHIASIKRLACCYKQGIGVAQDLKKACDYYLILGDKQEVINIKKQIDECTIM